MTWSSNMTFQHLKTIVPQNSSCHHLHLKEGQVLSQANPGPRIKSNELQGGLRMLVSTKGCLVTSQKNQVRAEVMVSLPATKKLKAASLRNLSSCKCPPLSAMIKAESKSNGASSISSWLHFPKASRLDAMQEYMNSSNPLLKLPNETRHRVSVENGLFRLVESPLDGNFGEVKRKTVRIVSHDNGTYVVKRETVEHVLKIHHLPLLLHMIE
ncbi:hypothetical protein CR513_11887, partial [Mucuna pruriens]